MDLYCLRVKRESAGKVFPFDRVYLAKNGEHGVFKKLFRYALILPVETGLKNLLLEYVEIEAGEAHPFDRDETAEPTKNDEWRVLLETEEWVLAVPILSKYVASNMPRYITAAGKYRDPSGKTRKRRRRSTMSMAEVREPFPTLTYLQTPEQNIRPVCIACPNFINHQNGHCRLGEDICYTHLALGMHNHFKEGTDAPPPSENMLIAEGDD
jgi:hypothetical protein